MTLSQAKILDTRKTNIHYRKQKDIWTALWKISLKQKMRRQAMDGKDIFAKHISDKVLVPRLCEKLSKLKSTEKRNNSQGRRSWPDTQALYQKR